MPIFEYQGKKYNVRDEHIDNFAKDYPDATSIQERDGKKYRVRSADYKTFMSETVQPQSSEQPIESAAAPVPVQEEPWKPTEREKIQIAAQMEQMRRSTQRTMSEFNESIENLREYREKSPLGNQAVESGLQFNPQTGKLERTYLTPLGNRYGSKGIADLESFRYRQAADMSVGGQLRRANQRLRELQAKRAERAEEVHSEWQEDFEKNKAPLAAVLAADTYVARQQSDRENSALDVAIRETEELIKNLEEQKDRESGVDVGFWRGFGRTVGDFRTWDFGMSDMRDALTMLHAEDLQGGNATEGEKEAYQSMMGAIHEREKADEMYGSNASFWNRAGVMTGYMPSFMLDFILTGGGYSGLQAAGRASTKAATKVVGEQAIKEMAEQGFKTYIKNNGIKGFGREAANWTIKALGTTADDLLIRAPLMTNTVQIGKTASDIIDRKLGNVVVGEDGNYEFANDGTWGDAIWQGEANAIIENYSEMFGAHLDPVVTLKNMSKLANLIGAKRLSGVLAKADAGALNGIMGQTHELFNKMGVSDYVGEVSEEYYGQLWRTMLNLDDAYQHNPDGTRTNLFLSGQFHGDIWGGMALSMGLMGAGKHTLTAVDYMSAKHGVNKADTKANELLGTEIWEPMKATIDLTTNDNIGEMADNIINDKDLTNEEKAAVLDYMERSLYMRGFNLATMAKSRNGELNEDIQQADESYIDGYSINSPQEMNDAKNLYEYHRQQLSNIVSEETLAMIDSNPVETLARLNNGEINSSERNAVIDYINAKQVYEGMMQRVRDDLDGRIEQSNSMVDARVNRTTGRIQGATMKLDDRKVYVISGNLVPYDDGTGIDLSKSDNSIIIRDAETGALEQVAPDAVLSVDESQDPNEQKALAADAIRQQFAQDAANKIDGVITFNLGDTYTISGEDGTQTQIQIVANENGIVDNGDGTVNVRDGSGNIAPMPKDFIQQQVDTQNIARIAEFEQQRTAENLAKEQAAFEAQRPQYALNDLVTLQDESGNIIHGQIADIMEADGRYVVDVDNPINGKYAPSLTREELDNMLVEYNGTAYERPRVDSPANTDTEQTPETTEADKQDNSAVETLQSEEQQQSALDRIPKDEQGQPIYEQVDSDTAWDAIVEQTEGDEAMAQNVADAMVTDKEAELKKIEKAKPKSGVSIAEKIAAERERKAAVDTARQQVEIWKKIAGTANRRKQVAEDERRRAADEAAALRRAEEERLRAEREEAERIEREALNGVPDMVDDVPKDARARGYRRVNGHKIDRQEPIPVIQGKEVAVKFSDNTIPSGHIAVIDASMLQPSHIAGMRNPLHFIDEAQPKERIDEASVLSAQKIAGNIRPEEITSSVTAYTGAPTVNVRGEVIQGNNRSAALRDMWDGYKEQAEKYRQYLKEHAQDFGLTPEAFDNVEKPVLVNMLDVDDNTAIALGQYVAQDTESGGTERIKPKNALQRMGNDMRSFANLLLQSTDDDTSFAGLVDRNGDEVLKWMNQRGYITPTQYKSAFDSKGNITAEAKNDLRGIMYQSIFKDGSTRLEEMFNLMPAKAQKAILATAYRDYDSSGAERMVEEIQNSIRAYYALSQDSQFAEAKNFKEARMAVEVWKRQYQIDDVTGGSYLPAENYSNFALHLAAMYKGESQGLIQGTFNRLYDLIQGTQEENLFEQPDNTPRSLAQAINEALNIDYNGQQRSNVLVGDSSASQRGQQGGDGSPAPRERTEVGDGTADNTGGTESGSGEVEIDESAEEAALSSRVKVLDDDREESNGEYPTYKRSIIIDGKHTAIQVDEPNEKGEYTGSYFEYDGKRFAGIPEVVGYIDSTPTLGQKVAEAEKQVNTNPTEPQKEAGNYRKGHVQVGTFDVTIENPKGSVRSGVDADGNKWSVMMNNSYGYIRGTEGVDGDHIDVFLSDDIDGWNGSHAFVIDQYNEDGTFDEHKVMLGFNEADEAQSAFTSNYDKEWAEKRKLVCTPVTIEEFEKWINSSHRKTKPFAEYKTVKKATATPGNENKPDGYTVERRFHKKNGTYIHAVKFTEQMPRERFLELKKRVKDFGGYYSSFGKGGFIFDNEADADKFAQAVLDPTGEQLNDAAPVSIADLRKVKTSDTDIQPIGHGAFGDIYDQFKGKAQEAIAFLSEKQGGEAIGALHHKDVGDIDLVWGNEGTGHSDGFGLAKLVKYHPEVLNDLQGLIDDMHVVSRNANRINLESDTHKAAVRLEWDGEKKNWLLTAFEKENSVRDNTTDTGTTVTGKQNDTATLQNTVSIDKNSDNSSNKQNPSGNKLVTDERYEELKRRMKAKLGQLNVGIDPEILAIGTEMAVYHIEKGARKFAEFAKAMIADLGDVVRPYLKAFYNGARDLPEVEDSGLSADMTSYDEVRTFDVANFDKENTDPFATAETVVAEQTIQEQADGVKQEIINHRNNERRKENEQTTADTEAIASQAEVTANKAESDIEAATTEQQVNDGIAIIDDQLEKVNQQLALLGYYEAEPVESDFNEAYGYMRNAEKKAVKDANSLAKRLIKDLGIDPETIVDKKGKKRRSYAVANIAPAGGDISVRLPLTNDRELYIDINLDTDYRVGIESRDNLALDHMYFRIENPNASGQSQYVGNNVWLNSDTTYSDMLRKVRDEIKYHAPGFNLAEVSTKSEENKTEKPKKARKNAVSSQIQGNLFGELFEEEIEPVNEPKKFSKGEKVLYKGQPATVFDIETDGRPVLDTGLAPMMYEVAELSDVKRINDNENGLQGNDAVRSERLPADSDRHEERLSESSESGSEIQTEENRGTDNIGERGSDEVNRTVRPRSADAVTAPKNTRNNHSERGANHAPTSVDARIDANIKAIELAQQLIENGETATPEQMSVLRKFSGWGGLGKAFSDNQTALRLQELLGAEGLEQAIMSANSAYYTPAYVVDTLWDIAEQMGFKGGNILEGSAGIGNILGQMPTSISERSDIHAIEIDQTSGSILSLLYPDAKVDIQGFEQTRIPNGSVDLAITNVPFVTGLRVDDTTGDKDLSKKFHNIHDFCIAKNVRKLREGGIGIFISSNGTLDNSKKLRDWIVSEGGSDFVGAFRMNNKTFGGTAVTSDIIVIRKRVNGKKSPNAIDVSTISGERTAEFDTGKTRKVKGQEIPIIKQLSMDYNRYFIEHPENMAGTMRFAFEEGDTFRPTSKGLYPARGKSQEQMLSDFVNSFSGKDWTDDGIRSGNETTSDNGYVADATADGKKVGELYEKDGKLVIASVGGYYPLEVNANKVKGHTKLECFKAYEAIKNALADVLDYQTNNESDKGLKPLLDKLNKVYDDFVSTYGHFNKNTSISFLRNDVDFPNVFSLEKYEETGDKNGNKVQKFGKTDVFSKRVVEKEKEPTPTNVKDGIIASVFKFGRIDVPYIAGQLGEDVEDVRKDIIDNGYGFEDPATLQIEVSFQYLSGNVREKLRIAQENNENGIYDGNIKALQEVIPMDIPAHLIDFTLGSSWIAPKLYEDYVKERTDIDVRFTATGGTWFMKAPDYGLNVEKNRSMGVVSEMLHKTIFGHTLIEAAIQNRSITVSQTNRKWDGTTETITDKEATQACAAKIDEIRQDFKDWARQKMQSDSEMSATIERIYNDTFNNFVPMSIPDDFVPEYFGGASHKFKMRSHQGKAIVRGTMQPLLLAHEVGTGKTFTLISTAMEMRRLGTARKPMIVVQNATVGQFVASAKELYPNAKILTLEESDRSAEGRKNFYAKIRYNDWDMIVVPQSTFEFIPDSEERQMAFVQDKIQEKMIVLEQMKEADPNGKSMITRQAEREIEQLEEQLAGLTDEASKKRTANDQKKKAVALQNAEVRAKEMLDRRTDDVENFDDMGIDALLIDEAHEYKHLGFATAMQRGVKGVDPSYSKKSQGVYLKTQAVLEKNNGRNVIFATGTPISNTAAEIWTFMRYLMPSDTMKEYGIYYFDDFVRNFGNIQQMLEFTTSGKFKENNRFAGYVNLPELVRIWSGVADTVLTREAGGVSDKIPEIENGKAQDIYLPQTRALRGIMKYVKAQLEEFEKMSGKEKREHSYIPLTMYGIAKAAAVDARLVQADAEDDPNSKTNEAVRQTLRSLKETASYKGTVAIFADNYQNNQSGFNIYEDIKSKLIAEGVPAEQIVVMKSGITDKKKLEIFAKVNRGEVRVILGSTFTLGTGVNIQERLHTLIHLDAPNRPMDYTQRNGRILRQGNLHKEMGKPVRILRFGVEDSLDVTAYQRLKTKGAIADSIMNGKQMMSNSMVNRVLEEDEDVFGDTVAQLSGSEYAMLKNNAEKNVRKYETRKKQWEVDQTYIHNAKPKFKALIASAEQRSKAQRGYLEAVKKAFPNGTFKEITAGKRSFTSFDEMSDFFKEHNKNILDEVKKMKQNGASGDQTRQISISLGGYTFKVQTVLSREVGRSGGQLFTDVHRKMTYSCPELGLEDVPIHQSLLRNGVEDIINNVITGKVFAERAEAAERSLAHNQSELEQLLSREGKPFEFSDELEQARKQYQEYSELMKKEMEEKEAKYAKMDAGIEVADNISGIDEDDDILMRDDDTVYRIRESDPPVKTGIGYKVFVLKNGKLYPPMVANPGGAETPVGVWLDADAAPIAGQSKTGRNQVKAGGKGTQGGSGKLAYRPGWHLGEIPYALQFNRMDEYGNKELFPANFVWAEVEYANDVDYQEEAMSYGMNANGKFQHSLAGLPRVPQNGSYRYRTNPNPETDPWIITGAMRVNRLLTPTEVDEMVEKAGREPQRRQEGAVTNEEIKNLNAQYQLADEMAAADTRAGRREMSDRLQEISKKLHLDNVEIVTTTNGLDGKKARAKGFYTKSTGKITIVLPNNRNIDDAMQTLLHEAVAHYGLRQMFGKHFDTFLDNVFNNASEDVRQKIVDLSKKYGWDFRKATEEYLAGLAERTDFENARKTGWWQKIKDFFIDMLHKIGLPDFRGVTLTDNELRYILWRSYENLKGNRFENVFTEAADTSMQYELKVGEYATDVQDNTMYRDGDPEVHERTLARDRYEQRVRSGMFQTQEALQDSMLGLKEAMRAILGRGKNIEDVDGFENAYLGENRLSSVNKAEADAFARLLFKPMLDEVARLAPTRAAREELTDYMMAKHGLERNRVMAERDAQKAFDEYQKAHPYGAKTLQDFLNEYSEKDYAGLTALTGFENVADAEAEAQQMVSDYEADNETADLWDKVNAVSKAILQKSYECGMMSKATYDNISDMYEFYIPLRGFDEKTSAEAYSYLAHRQSAFNAPIKKAEGRRSKADDPFANLQSMAESAIMQGNRNKLVKQRFLNFALNHPSDLVSISDLWLEYDSVTDEWKPVFPDNIEVSDSPETVEQKMHDFEEKMNQLEQQSPDLYKRGRDAENIPYRVIDSRDLRQHQVVVKRGGRDYVITINGNPRAAQALNGQTNPDNDTSGVIGAVLRAGEKLNRQLSAFYTTRNPDFIVSNFMRDMLYTNSMAWIKESPNYALRFHRNYLTKANPARMKILLAKLRNGTLDMNDKTESMFYQFMMNGGETGYANIRDIEQHKNDIRKELKKANGKLNIRRAMSLLAERLDELNRAVENCARFAAFVTSREMGRSLDRAIYDAKEISVNFNKKGSGAKFYDTAGQTKSGNAAAFVSGLGRSGYVFWNAAIQGTANFGRQFKRHPEKAFTGAAVMFLLGAIIAYLGGDDDDDDKNAYYNLPEYVRRSNILFRIGDSWISVPLPVEYRALYGMGELMTSTLNGKEHFTGGELAEQIAAQMSQILPLDLMNDGGLMGLVPSSIKPFAEIHENKSWTGLPIYKDTPWNKDMPEWTKVYKSANRELVNLAAVLNEISGGDAYTKGAIDINPAKVEHLLEGYFGGVASTIDKMTKTAETIAGEREYDPRSILLVNRLVKAGDERTEYRAVNNEYFRLKEEHDRIGTRLRHYENDTDNGIFDYAEKIDFLYNSPEYERWEIFEFYKDDIDDLYDELKEAVDGDERKDIESELNEVKKEMISEMNLTRKRK